MDEIRSVSDLIESRPGEGVVPFRDPNNLNKGTERGRDLVKRSVRDNLFGRPMLAAADGGMIAGNHTHEAVEQLRDEGLPIGEPIIIRTDGTRPIIHVREDIPDLADPRAVRLKVLDNRTNELNYNADLTATREQLAALEIEPSDVGYSVEELQADGEAPPVLAPEEPERRLGESFSVVIDCNDEQHQQKVYEEMRGAGHDCRLLTL